MPVNYAVLKATSPVEMQQTYTQKDTILYALGVGVGAEDPCDVEDLRFVYEVGLEMLPTQVVVLAFDPIWLANPEFGITYSHILHLAQTLTLHRPLPSQGTVISELTVDSILDKGEGNGAVLCLTRRLRETDSDTVLATVGHVLFLSADGGFGGPRGEPPEPGAVPSERAPDFVCQLPNRANQALVYRLSGDTNPLHVDPAMAGKAGFPMPILHGLCAYGMVGRALLRQYCGNEPARLRRLDVRFTQPVFPGEPLELQVWNQTPGGTAFRVMAPEREVVVEDYGLFEYRV